MAGGSRPRHRRASSDDPFPAGPPLQDGPVRSCTVPQVGGIPPFCLETRDPWGWVTGPRHTEAGRWNWQPQPAPGPLCPVRDPRGGPVGGETPFPPRQRAVPKRGLARWVGSRALVADFSPGWAQASTCRNAVTGTHPGTSPRNGRCCLGSLKDGVGRKAELSFGSSLPPLWGHTGPGVGLGSLPGLRGQYLVGLCSFVCPLAPVRGHLQPGVPSAAPNRRGGWVRSVCACSLAGRPPADPLCPKR